MTVDTGIGPDGYHAQYYADRSWREYAHVLALLIRHSEPGPILDLGAGCAYLVEAAKRWGLDAIGLEGSEEAIRLTRDRRPDLDVQHHRLSNQLPFAASSFQTAVLNQVIEHLEPDVAGNVLSETWRVLRPCGMILVMSPSSANKREQRADPTHINMMSPTQLHRLLHEHGFERIAPLDSPLPLLGNSRVGRGLMHVLFKCIAADRFSATANAIAYKGQ